MTVTWRAVDAAGVQWSSASVTLPGGQSFLQCGMATRQSGTTADGRWSQTCPILSAAPNGKYSVWISASDPVGNRRAQAFDGTSWEYDATFTVAGGSNDTEGPVVSEVVVEPVSVTAGGSVTVTWRAVDAAGVQWSSASVTLPGGQSFLQCGMATRQSGTEADGRWSQTCPIPAAAVNGTDTVWVSASDVVSNQRYREFDGSAWQYDATFTVTS